MWWSVDTSRYRARDCWYLRTTRRIDGPDHSRQSTAGSLEVVTTDPGVEAWSVDFDELEMDDVTVSLAGTDVDVLPTDSLGDAPDELASLGRYVHVEALTDDGELHTFELHYDEADLGDVDAETLSRW